MKCLTPYPILARYPAILLIMMFAGQPALPQSADFITDSLTRVLNAHPKEDAAKVDLLATLSIATKDKDAYQSISYLDDALRIAKKNKNRQQETGIRSMLGFAQMEIGESIKSIENFQAILEMGDLPDDIRNLALNFIGLNYKAQGDLDKAFDYSKKADQFKTSDPRNIILQPYNYGDIYYKKGLIDSALKFGTLAFRNISLVPAYVKDQFSAEIACLLGNIYTRINRKDSAFYYIRHALQVAAIRTDDIYLSLNKVVSETESQLSMAKWFEKWGTRDSVYYYGMKAYNRANEAHNYNYMLQSALFLKSAYVNEHNYKQAILFNDLALVAKDSLQGLEKVKKTQAMHYEFKLREQQLAELEKQLALKARIRILLIFAVFIALFTILLYRTVRQRKKTIGTLSVQNKLIETQKTQLQSYIQDLQEKQTQLIHAEKMASLGELTAGIAHEIQNPLNFVNNFSELNNELLQELKSNPNMDKDPGSSDTLQMIEENSKKILLHGRRAETIVRSMLEYSRSKPGEKVKTDMNALTEEYLKLSYHAIHARDKSFYVNLVTEFEPTLPELYVLPAEIGRVLLNLFNNSFYSLSEKKKKLKDAFHPTLNISTCISRSLHDSKIVQISIRDNGTGINKSILSKVFQPFFTTKPTGSGTGLGLSLSYDIIQKAHGGTITIDSDEGEYCTFIIGLPLRE